MPRIGFTLGIIGTSILGGALGSGVMLCILGAASLIQAEEPHSIQEKAKRLTDGKEVSEPIYPQMLLRRIKTLERKVEALEKAVLLPEELPPPADNSDFDWSSPPEVWDKLLPKGD